jgi:S-(hydroxymethyl)glutathione dehydrogenase/alcohol dehydrogenase
MKTRAAVAFEPKKPLEIVEVDLEGPKAGEVLVEIMATGVCHTDAYTLDGFDSEGDLPSILAMKAQDRARSGAGRHQREAGRSRDPALHPECRQCKSCLSGKTNLCTAIRATQGKGLMPDGTTRFPTRVSRSSITWAARRSRTSPSFPKSRSPRSARTRRSSRAATSVAA